MTLSETNQNKNRLKLSFIHQKDLLEQSELLYTGFAVLEKSRTDSCARGVLLEVRGLV